MADIVVTADFDDIVKVGQETDKVSKKVQALAKTYEKGALTSKAYFKGQVQQISALRKLGFGYQEARKYVFDLSRQTRDAAQAQRELEMATHASNKAQNRMGVVTQQVGYQVGDFLVQVQSGTNAFVAFGQQATQLVGVLPLVAGNLGLTTTAAIGLSTALGIGIPLVTSILAAFSRMGKEVEESANKVKTVSERIEELGDKLLEFSQKRKAANLGVSLDELFGLTTIEQVEDKIARLQEVIVNASSLGDTGGGGGLLSEADIQRFQEAQEELRVAQVQLTLLRLEEQRKLEEEFARDNAQTKLDYALQYFDDYVAMEKDALARNQQEREELRQREEADAQARLDKALAWFDGEMTMLTEGYKITRQEAELLNDAAAELGERLGVSFTTALELIRQAKAEATVGLDAFGGAGDFKYSSAQTIKPPKISSSGGGGGTASRLESFISGLMTERETLEQWRSEQLELLNKYNESELAIIGGHAEAKYRIEKEYADKLRDLEEEKQKDKVSAISGGIQAVLTAAAGGNEKMLKMAQVVGATEALINSYRAAAQALADPTVPFYAKFAAAAATLAAGFGLVNSLKSLSSSSSVGTASVSGAEATVATTETPATPQRVIIEGIDRDSLITGQQLANIFDALYEENKDRGFVFEVAQ